jgi:hypothetical protein
MAGIYEVCCWDGLKCYDIYIKFHTDLWRHSKVDMKEFTDTQHGDLISLLIIIQNKESSLQNAIKLSFTTNYIKMELVRNILETVSASKMNDAAAHCIYTHGIRPCSLVPYPSADCFRNSARSQVVSHHNPCCLIWDSSLVLPFDLLWCPSLVQASGWQGTVLQWAMAIKKH